MKIELEKRDIEILADIVSQRVFEKIKNLPTMRLLTIEELANTLSVPKSWIYEKTRNKTKGGIPCVRIGKYVRFNLQEVLKWLEDNNQ